MVDKKLHVCYTQKIKSLQVIDFTGYICNVTIDSISEPSFPEAY